MDLFLQKHNEYYLDKVNEAELTEDTTQAYWQSMKLSKHRMLESNLTMKVDCKPYEQKDLFKKDRQMSLVKDGILGIFLKIFVPQEDRENHLAKGSGNRRENTTYSVEENIVAKRTFYKNGRIIYRDRNREICQTDYIKSAIEGENATCPNCGNVADVSTYIDGCDYCSAKFTVRELEEKVSGFSFREDISGKLSSFIKLMDTLGVVVINGLPTLMPLIISIIAIGVISLPEYTHLKLNTLGSMSILFIIPMVFLLALGIRITLFRNKLYHRKMQTEIGRRINLGEEVKMTPSKYFCQDFLQNLEWKLKSIFMADDFSEKKSFVKCDVKELVSENRDVVDCSASKLDINTIKKYGGYSEISGDVTVRKYRYLNGRIKKSSEVYGFTATCKKEVEERPMTAIRQYVCPGCGGSIDVMSGSGCGYCGKMLDYADIGWVITELNLQGKEKSQYPKMALRILGSHLVTFLAAFFISFVLVAMSEAETREFIALVFNRSLVNEAYEIMDEKTALDDFAPDAVCQTGYELGFYNRRYDYALNENANATMQEIMKSYNDYLEAKGYIVWNVSLDGPSGFIQAYLPGKLRYTGYPLDITIEFDEKTALVYEAIGEPLN